MQRKFYEIQPRSGSYYLLENGEPIARFNKLEKAEAAHAMYVAELAATYERNADRFTSIRGEKAEETGAFIDRREAERLLYKTLTVGQLVSALVESRDQSDIRHVFANHAGGTRGFEIACQRLGVSKSRWDYAMNEAGFYALVGIIADKLGIPRYDPDAEKARREKDCRADESKVR
jgi:hypothetical protein